MAWQYFTPGEGNRPLNSDDELRTLKKLANVADQIASGVAPPPGSGFLQVNTTTGSIESPITPEQFKTANEIAGVNGDGNIEAFVQLSDATGIALGADVLGQVDGAVVIGDGVENGEDLPRAFPMLPWQDQTSNFAAVDKGQYRMADNITATLPATPGPDFIAFFADRGLEWNDATPALIDPNGNDINGQGDDFELSAVGASIAISFRSGSYWVNTVG